MFKITAVLTDGIEAYVAFEEEEMHFHTYEEAEQFLRRIEKERALHLDYKWTITKV